ncbi:hypothetical protein B0A54_16608 [Friedmanniomyces endolithicus]|uniref:Uncharacterized protein n=1 Tax=Friedmanniomyces endolithicus TaxID=329885 RepID=A0A4U0U9H1_9PEZI|nr:hypothetical protein B0A54_16608 [Friedmanniomyces endolithicus]
MAHLLAQNIADTDGAEGLRRFLEVEEGRRDLAKCAGQRVHQDALDLGLVNVRLERILERETGSSIASTESSLSPKEQVQEDLRTETWAYQALEDSGALLPFSRHLLEQFVRAPRQYLDHPHYGDIIRYCDEYRSSPDRMELCVQYHRRWRAFFKLQRVIRNQTVESARSLIVDTHRYNWAWEEPNETFHPKPGNWTFADYFDDVKQRAQSHGCPLPFQLERNIEQQDHQSTWAEYFAFECNVHDYAAAKGKALRPKHDHKWEDLRKSGLLKEGMTWEKLRDFGTIWHNVAETKQAEEDIQPACVVSPGAEERLQTLVKRGELTKAYIDRTRKFHFAQENARRHLHLINWLRRLMSSASEEHEAPQAIMLPTPPENQSTRKRRLDAEMDEPPARRRKLGAHAGEEPDRPFRRPRRNARLAAIEDASAAAVDRRESAKLAAGGDTGAVARDTDVSARAAAGGDAGAACLNNSVGARRRPRARAGGEAARPDGPLRRSARVAARTNDKAVALTTNTSAG